MFKERDQVDPFFYDPDSEVEHQMNILNSPFNDPDFLYDQWKDQQIEKAMNHDHQDQ